MNDFAKKHPDLEKPVTLGVLLAFTDEFLLPKVGEMMDGLRGEMGGLRDEMNGLKSEMRKEMSAMEHRLKVYIDDKLADYTSDIFKRLEKRDIKDREFKARVVEILKRNKLASSEEVAYLDGLVRGNS